MTEEKKSQCRFLRTKTSYTPDADNLEFWRSGRSATAQYWCLCTMTTAGPDNDLVAPEVCQETRDCFQIIELPV
jgi:hypothetical protein